MLESPILFSIPGYEAFAAALADRLGAELGTVTRQTFPDGELYQRIDSRLAQRDALVVGGTHDDASTLTLFDLSCALAKYGVRRLDLVVPYFGYSTMERMTYPGEVVTAKTRTRLLSAIPAAPFGNRIWCIDLHNEGLPHYFEGHAVSRNLTAKSVLLPHIKALGGPDLVLASTDAGRAKWVQGLAQELRCQAAIIIKRRMSGTDTQITSVSCDVAGKNVVIYDDMIRTGGSLLAAATAYREAGANQIDVVATHGVFPGQAYERLRDSGLVRSVTCTNSHPRATALAPLGLHVLDVSGVFADHIANGG
ncbi:MAG: ribose-phosphate diphosphokinase [Deltaproteobacteria bacterium]|nr:ribose-phosphate diphosphokinase [Deltaproteobacteria bacterium]